MRKAAVLLLVFIIFASAVLMIMQKKMDEEMDRFVAIKENMERFEYNKDMLGIAVTRVMTSKSVMHNFGKPIYPDDKKSQYVWVYIKLVNSGKTAAQVKPDEFTLSISGKGAVNYDIKATNSMQKCLKPVNLNPNEQYIGVLIFPLPASNEYILHYSGPGGKVEKRLAMESPL